MKCKYVMLSISEWFLLVKTLELSLDLGNLSKYAIGLRGEEPIFSLFCYCENFKKNCVE